MPANRPSEIWEHPTYKYAYVREHRGSACTVIHGSYPKSTGYKFVRSARVNVMKILEQRLQEHLGFGTQFESPGSRTCGSLFEQFVIVKYPKLERLRRLEYKRYFKFVPASLPVTDTEKIRTALMKRVSESTYSVNTLNRLYTRIRTVFRFGIEQGWLTVNPVHKDMIPTAVTADPTPYADEQIDAALEKLTGRSKAFVSFLNATGCRPIEATRLTWEDVHADHCIVWSSKGATTAIRRRVVPYSLCTGTLEAITMAKGAPWSSAERVFGTKTYVKAAEQFNAALGEGVARGLYDIRKAVINRWKRLGWPEEVRHAIAGHEKDVAERHYESPYSAVELARIVQASRPAQEPEKAPKPVQRKGSRKV